MAVLPDESHIDTDFTPYVPRLVIEWLADDPDRDWREIDGTMAFVDISGFTAMSEKLATQGKAGAEQVTDVMNATFDALLGSRTTTAAGCSSSAATHCSCSSTTRGTSAGPRGPPSRCGRRCARSAVQRPRQGRSR